MWELVYFLQFMCVSVNCVVLVEGREEHVYSTINNYLHSRMDVVRRKKHYRESHWKDNNVKLDKCSSLSFLVFPSIRILFCHVVHNYGICVLLYSYIPLQIPSATLEWDSVKDDARHSTTAIQVSSYGRYKLVSLCVNFIILCYSNLLAIVCQSMVRWYACGVWFAFIMAVTCNA